MDPRRRMLALLLVFVSLLAFHLWLLSRTVARGDTLLSGLLVVAIGMFAWRIAHYTHRYHAIAAPSEAAKDAEAELRQIRVMIPVLLGLLVLHGSLIGVTLSVAPLTWTEYALAALLVSAVIAFVTRLVYYARRYRALRRSH